MMDEALALCGAREVRLDAQAAMTGLYAGFGFEVSGPAYDEDGILHVPMVRAGLRRPPRP
jgi:ElaA protein